MERSRRNSSKNTRKYKKRFLWTVRNEKILLKLWKERVHDLKNSHRTKQLYEEMREQLQQKGCFVEINEIAHKIMNLSSKYRKERVSRAAGCSPSDWPLYDVLDDMLSSFEMDKVVNLMGKISRCLGDKSSPHQINSKKSEAYVSNEYVNEDFFDNEDENEEDEDDDVAASTTISESKNANSNNDTIHLQAINTNLELLVEKVNELSENIQSWEEKGNAQLVQISSILRNHKTRASEYNNSLLMPAKIIKKLSQNDDAMEDISIFDEEIPKDQMGEEDETKIPTMKSYASQRNKIIIDDYLKTKQLEREFMTEKHNIQMEILKLELEAKRNEVLRDA